MSDPVISKQCTKNSAKKVHCILKGWFKIENKMKQIRKCSPKCKIEIDSNSKSIEAKT